MFIYNHLKIRLSPNRIHTVSELHQCCSKNLCLLEKRTSRTTQIHSAQNAQILPTCSLHTV